MRLKTKALLFNFLGFAAIFLLVRFGLVYFLELGRIFMVLIAAITASVLAPKFTVIKADNGEKLLMKWVFLKGVKEV